MPRGLFITAGPIFKIAKDALTRTCEAPSDNSPDQKDALISVVFAVAALECFINESSEITQTSIDIQQEETPGWLQTYRDLQKEVGDYGSTQHKFQMASLALCGTTFDKSSGPYQDFHTLIRLRNSLVHLGPRDNFILSPDGTMDIEAPTIVQELRNKNILAQMNPGVRASWIALISTRGVAKWACRTASQMVLSTLDLIQSTTPENSFKHMMEMFYRRSFQPENANLT